MRFPAAAEPYPRPLGLLVFGLTCGKGKSRDGIYITAYDETTGRQDSGSKSYRCKSCTRHMVHGSLLLYTYEGDSILDFAERYVRHDVA